MLDEAGRRRAARGVSASPIEIHALGDGERGWADQALRTRWGSPIIVTLAGRQDAACLPGLIATLGTEPVGLLTYAVRDGACEVVTLDSFAERRGVGSALLEAVREVAAAAGCERLWLSTTNDNLAALRFYQRRGWDLVALHRDVVAQWRRSKPVIPERGRDEIPLRHALELELRLPRGTQHER